MLISDEISHRGKVISVGPSETVVEIVSESACASCHAAALCGMSESRKKMVTVTTAPAGWQAGDEVEVSLRRGLGLKAVRLAYVLPLVLLVAVLLGALAAGASEPLAGAVSIGAVALWYLCLWLLKDRLNNGYSFYIKK